MKEEMSRRWAEAEKRGRYWGRTGGGTSVQSGWQHCPQPDVGKTSASVRDLPQRSWRSANGQLLNVTAFLHTLTVAELVAALTKAVRHCSRVLRARPIGRGWAQRQCKQHKLKRRHTVWAAERLQASASLALLLSPHTHCGLPTQSATTTSS
jgi:hypothetical protein